MYRRQSRGDEHEQGVATVADTWRPTSELEHRLQETVRAGDQESYFRLIADSELVIPVPPDRVDGMLSGETQPSWPTQEEDGRVHVLVYTSASAMRACLGPSYQHFMTVRFGEIAETWPDNRWWLAIDVPARGVRAALPIEARLPSWFVRQVADGDGRPPQVGRASAPWEELRDQHRELPRESPRQEFQPANDVERELLRAAANNDHDLFLQTLAGTDVLLPVPDDTDYAMRPGRPGFPWQTREVDGSTVVPVFTSPERLVEAARAAGTGTEYIKLPFNVALRYWPNHDWLLAINSGSPAGGTVLAQQLPGLATWADQRAAQRMTNGFEPQNDVEGRLFDAARRRDTDAFFKILLGAQVLVPADPDTPWGVVPDDPAFPWRPVSVHGRTSIQIFTSLKWMNEAIGSSRFIMPTLMEMVTAWPDPDWDLVLNPGTPIDAAMPGEKVRSLGGPPRPRDAATPPSASTPPPADAPAVPVAPAVPSEPETPAPATPGVPTPLGDGPGNPGAPEPSTQPPEPSAPTGIAATAPGTPDEPTAQQPPGTGDPAGIGTGPGAPLGTAPEPTAQQRPEASDPASTGSAAPEAPHGPAPEPTAPPRPEASEPTGMTTAGPGGPHGPGPQSGEAGQGGAAAGPGTPPEASQGAPGAPDPGRYSGPSGGSPAGPDPAAQDAFGGPSSPGSQGDPAGPTIPEPLGERVAGPPLPNETAPQGVPADTPGRDVSEGGHGGPASAVPGEPPGVNVPPSQQAPGMPAAPGVAGIPGPAGAAGGHPDMRVAGPRSPQETAPQPQGGESAPPGAHGAPGLPGDQVGREAADASAPSVPGPGAAPPGPQPVPGMGPTGQPGGPAGQSTSGGPGTEMGPSPQGGHAASGMPGGGPRDPQVAAQAQGGPGAPDGAHAGQGPRPGERTLRAVGEPEKVFEPGNRIDQELYEAALSGDSDAFLRVLLNANVLVPIPPDAPLEVTPVQREFRWDAALRSESAVQAFTSLVRLREVMPESRFVYADFRELIGAWPREDWTMLLNPGTRIGASLQGDQVRALSEWAVRVGLVQARPEVPVPPPRRDPAPQMPPDDLDDRLSSPAIMQKVVPHGHVAWYLEQRYDRVGGFVHLTSDVAELQTPIQLYEALGLLYEGSPFSPADEGVYVIRWPAYCPDLYRIPFGGRDEEELASWGEAGWVIERPPFVGGGFAPGSAGSIREYKVDSVRLPFGAEMYYLGRDRSERFIAMYDPDRLAWLRPETGAEAWNGRTEATQ